MMCTCAEIAAVGFSDGRLRDKCRLKEAFRDEQISWLMAATLSGRVVFFQLYTACSQKKVCDCVHNFVLQSCTGLS